MVDAPYFKTLFRVGSLWNAAAVVPLLLFQEEIFAFLGMAPPAYAVFYQMFCFRLSEEKYPYATV